MGRVEDYHLPRRAKNSALMTFPAASAATGYNTISRLVFRSFFFPPFFFFLNLSDICIIRIIYTMYIYFRIYPCLKNVKTMSRSKGLLRSVRKDIIILKA